MNRISVAEAAHDFPKILRRVTGHGESLALEDERRVVAWLTPPGDREYTVADLERLFASLPALGEDVDDFARDVELANALLAAEVSRWE